MGYGQDVEHVGEDEPAFAFGFVDLGADASVTQVAMDETHSCAVLAKGTVRCWGNNEYGQLGYSEPDTKTVGDDETPAEYYEMIGQSDVKLW